MKKLPWTSLLLVLCTYAVFGWLISAEAPDLAKAAADGYSLTTPSPETSWLFWVMGGVYILLIASALAAPFRMIQTFYTSWLQSDTRAFISVIVGAFVAVVFLNWFNLFIRILVLISASALARLDLQTAGYNKWQAFRILVVVPLVGFSIGILAQHLGGSMDAESLPRL